MVINEFELEYRARDVLRRYNEADSLNEEQQQCKELVNDIFLTILQIRLSRSSFFNFDPITRLQLKGKYCQELLVKVFSQLHLTVTQYTNGCGMSLVFFEPTP